MNNQNPCYAFTIKHNAIARKLCTKVDVTNQSKVVKGIALWDTGATGSCISEQMVKDLGLIPTGKQKIFTPSGDKIVNTYIVDIVLPNRVAVKGVHVCDSDIGSQGLDMLIGMDIITLGDFTITNFNGKTIFTFRMPSQKAVDYVMQSAVKGSHQKKK